EDVRQREQLGPPLGRRRDLDQRQLALDRLARHELGHAQDVDELVHLLLDLLERVLLAVDPQRDAGDIVPLRRAHRERVDVVAAPREHADDAQERAGLVLEQRRDRVPHLATPFPSAPRPAAEAAASPEYSIRSSAAAPAGIIGKHCSRGSTRQSTTAVRPSDSASASAGSSSSSEDTVKPAAPYASASAA